MTAPRNYCLFAWTVLLSSTLIGRAESAFPSNSSVPSITNNSPFASSVSVTFPSRVDSSSDARPNVGVTSKKPAAKKENPFVKENGVVWATGPGEGILGGIARIKIDEGARMTSVRGAVTWLGQRNLATNGHELGVIIGPKGLWAALAVMLPLTNIQPAQLAAQLPELLPDLLPRLNQAIPRDASTKGGASRRVDWLTEPQIDEYGQWMHWCLEETVGGVTQLLPGAAFFSARGTLVLHFFGPPDLKPGLCFSSLRNLTILSPTRAIDARPVTARTLAQVFTEPRVQNLNQRIQTAAAKSKGSNAAPTKPIPAIAAPAKPVEIESKPEKHFGDNSDDIVIALLGLAGLLILGLLIGTRPVRKPRRRRRSDPQAYEEAVR